MSRSSDEKAITHNGSPSTFKLGDGLDAAADDGSAASSTALVDAEVAVFPHRHHGRPALGRQARRDGCRQRWASNTSRPSRWRCGSTGRREGRDGGRGPPTPPWRHIRTCGYRPTSMSPPVAGNQTARRGSRASRRTAARSRPDNSRCETRCPGSAPTRTTLRSGRSRRGGTREPIPPPPRSCR